MIEQSKFIYFPLREALEKERNIIEDQGEKQIKGIKDQGENQIKEPENNQKRYLKFRSENNHFIVLKNEIHTNKKIVEMENKLNRNC